MCGICGLWQQKGVDERIVRSMNEILVFRSDGTNVGLNESFL